LVDSFEFERYLPIAEEVSVNARYVLQKIESSCIREVLLQA